MRPILLPCIYLLLILPFGLPQVQAQQTQPQTAQPTDSYVLYNKVPVRHQSGTPMQYPWAGGMNSMQFASLDLNANGTEDLLAFDRSNSQWHTFLRSNGTYTLAPEYAGYLPTISNWMQLHDYNSDGLKDLFVGTSLGIQVWRNVTIPGNPPNWQLALPFLMVESGEATFNLKVNVTDIPGIADLDDDGDLDILAFDFVAGARIIHYKNYSVERLGRADSLVFVQENSHWGNFEDCNCGTYAFGQTCDELLNGRLMHAGGSALMLWNPDGDSDLDLLLGQEGCETVYQLHNTGSPQIAAITSVAQSFPGTTNALAQLSFPATFYEDVNADGSKDLLASPNIFANTANSLANFYQSVALYENQGTNTQPLFNTQSKPFLQNEMIETGEASQPTLADLDGDGDLDLVVSNRGRFVAGNNFIAAPFLYENIGTPNTPQWQQITDNYLLLGSQNLQNMSLQFVDMNADGRKDLVINARFPDTPWQQLYVVPNQNSQGLGNYPFQEGYFMGPALNTEDMAWLTDVDQDGLTDLLLGRINGDLNYLRNTGTTNVPAFTLQEQRFKGVASAVHQGWIAPTTGDYDGDGLEDLLFSTWKGQLWAIPNFRSAEAPEAYPILMYNQRTQAEWAGGLDRRARPAIAPVFGEGRLPGIIVGNVAGGLKLLRNLEDLNRQPGPDDDPLVLSLYPNPVLESQTLTISTEANATLSIHSMLGQQILGETTIAAQESLVLSTTGLAPGIYIVVARHPTLGQSVQRFIVTQ